MTATSDTANTQAAAADPEPALEQLLAALEELERCLHDELQALTACETGPLLDAVERKRHAVRSVEELVNCSPLRALLPCPVPGHCGNRDASNDYRDAKARLARLPAWPLILARLSSCRNLNQTAGGALASARRGIEGTLRLLGRMPQHPTYGSDGNPFERPERRDLGLC